MKTSTRILIILLISIPVTMFAFNWLAINEYKTGNFNFIYTPPADEKRELPAFKHVVMDGRLHHSKGSQPLNGLLLDIASDPGQKPTLVIPELVREFTTVKITNDTLYISYYKKNIDIESALFWSWGRLSLYGSTINSLTLNHGSYLITHLTTDSLKLQTTDAEVNVNNLTATTLKTLAYGRSAIHLNPNNNIEHCEYSIYDENGKLEVERNASKSYKPGKVHPDAQLILIGKASEMQKYIVDQSFVTSH